MSVTASASGHRHRRSAAIHDLDAALSREKSELEVMDQMARAAQEGCSTPTRAKDAGEKKGRVSFSPVVETIPRFEERCLGKERHRRLRSLAGLFQRTPRQSYRAPTPPPTLPTAGLDMHAIDLEAEFDAASSHETIFDRTVEPTTLHKKSSSADLLCQFRRPPQQQQHWRAGSLPDVGAAWKSLLAKKRKMSALEEVDAERETADVPGGVSPRPSLAYSSSSTLLSDPASPCPVEWLDHRLTCVDFGDPGPEVGQPGDPQPQLDGAMMLRSTWKRMRFWRKAGQRAEVGREIGR